MARLSPPVDVVPARAHGLSLLPMRPFLDAVFSEMDGAQRRLFVECYIVKDDLLGRALVERLLAAAARKVDVRLLYDPSGSHVTPSATWRRLRAGGVKVRAFGPLAFLGLLKPAPRNHARVVLIDHAAYTGGHAWADPWLPKEDGGEGWRDLNCRVEGPVVEDWATLFEARWKHNRHVTEIDTESKYPDLRLVSDGPGKHDLMVQAHIDAVDRARERIWVANAYFFPMRRLARALFRAAARGIDVRIIVPGDATDLPIVRRAARATYAAWIQRGLSLFECEPPMMHGKYAIIDGDWSTVGSFNINASGVSLAVESNLVVYRPAFVDDVAREFQEELARSRRVDPAALSRRSLPVRFVDALARTALLMLEGLIWTAGSFNRPARKRAARAARE